MRIKSTFPMYRLPPLPCDFRIVGHGMHPIQGFMMLYAPWKHSKQNLTRFFDFNSHYVANRMCQTGPDHKLVFAKHLLRSSAHTHRMKTTSSFKAMLIDTKHAHSAHNDIKGQPHETRYASSSELSISCKCLDYVTKAYVMRCNTDTA